ncbi:TlpA family protein disulfide reductase [Salinimicrobium xinjiangense]|uniref:TlpA family protein disulfide reductase n=1 Tax=Salinimicrobium xinjiangense TaxID=438596 RepID=UPI0012ECADA6|nr:hypothetical protein [Salinimicrobium xinjiangense]
MRKLGLNKYFSAASALLLLSTVIFYYSCGNFSDPTPSYAYIGGEIINPTINHVIIKRKGVVLDTVKLNNKNKFSYKIENAEQGLYLLLHKPETQNIYISPGDSLLLRANTLAFDESLHFSGKGRARNNFMAEMYLHDEANSDLLLNFQEYNPGLFEKKADSIHQSRLDHLQRVAEKNKFSNDFVALAKEVIKYENNDLKERYSYLVSKYYKEYSKQFPENFHSYRDDANFNSENLQCSPGYKRFLENYLINYSLSWCGSSGLDSDDCSNLSNVENVNSRIRKAGELVQLPTLRKDLLRKIAIRGIVSASSRENIISILNELKNQDLPEEDLDEMRQLGSIQLAYLPGTSLGNVRLLNMDGQFVTMDSIIKKPSIIYLWSVYKLGHVEEHQDIAKYRKKYPEIDFIGVNLDVSEEPAWRVAVRNNFYDPEFAYQLAPTRINKQFFDYYLDKVLFINSSGEVVSGDIYLGSSQFETKILEFINQ